MPPPTNGRVHNSGELRVGVGETSFLKRGESRQEMENETEFEARNGCKWETRRDEIHNFSMKNKKNGKTGEKKWEKLLKKNKKKTGKKTKKYKKYRKRF